MGSDRDFLGGKLLIATPNMGDARFERTVILMCTHDERHAMGVIVNKPMKNIDLADLIEKSEIDKKVAMKNSPVFFGGPVSPEKGLVVHTLDYQTEGTIKISERLGVTVSRTILEDILIAQNTMPDANIGLSEIPFGLNYDQRPSSEHPSLYRLVAGHAGWGAGQLEAEIAANAWAHCDADDTLIFSDDGNSVWQSAFNSLGVTEAMFSPAWSSTRNANTLLN
ncbi:MAG: YqgE/AlgH family protein [Pseudomonadota bacterium]